MRIAALAVACLPLHCMPFATPPVQVSAAAGAMPGLRPEPDGAAGLWNVRASVHPADLAPRAQLRALDAGMGFTVDSRRLFGSPSYTRGAFVQLGYYPWVRPVGKDVAVRVGPFATAELLWRDGGQRPGWGGSTGLAAELNGWVHGCEAGRGVAACGRGLLGGRVFVAMNVREVDGVRYAAPLLGLSYRLPVSVGVVAVRTRRW